MNRLSRVYQLDKSRVCQPGKSRVHQQGGWFETCLQLLDEEAAADHIRIGHSADPHQGVGGAPPSKEVVDDENAVSRDEILGGHVDIRRRSERVRLV